MILRKTTSFSKTVFWEKLFSSLRLEHVRSVHCRIDYCAQNVSKIRRYICTDMNHCDRRASLREISIKSLSFLSTTGVNLSKATKTRPWTSNVAGYSIWVYAEAEIRRRKIVANFCVRRSDVCVCSMNGSVVMDFSQNNFRRQSRVTDAWPSADRRKKNRERPKTERTV